MKSAGINKQLTKRDSLLPTLPEDVIEECKPLLRIPEADLGTHPYRDLKHEILQIYGKKQQDAFARAFSRKLEGRPSALGKLLIHDICPAPKPLTGCHCAPMVWGFWHRQLPQSCKDKLAGKTFDSTTYKQLFIEADDVWASNGGVANAEPAVVAAVQQPQQPQALTPQVAAATFRGRGRGNRARGRGATRGNQGGGRGGRTTPTPTTPTTSSDKPQWNPATRHADQPPIGVCSEHWRSGSQAKWCYSPLDCPWVNRIVPRQNANKNQ